MKYRYPCTKHIETQGFGSFLEEELQSSRYNINEFTEELKARFGVPYLSLVNSGSSANLVAALALAEKVKKADLPLVAAVAALSFPTTISSLILAGFNVKIVDVEKDSFNISFDALCELEKKNELPTVIAATHFLGFPFKAKEISEMIHDQGGFLLQDGCETLGMLIDKIPAFKYGDIFTWSFYHPHHLSSYGGGGVITLNQEDYSLVDSISHWGRSCKCHIDKDLCNVPNGPAHQFTYERIGLNVEMSELNACFGRWQLRRWNKIEEIRHRNYKVLFEELKEVKSIKVWEEPEINSTAFVFPIRMLDGKTVLDAYQILSPEGIEIRTLMGGVSNEQKAFIKILGDERQKNAHELAESTFFVGIHQTIPEEDIRVVAKTIRNLLS